MKKVSFKKIDAFASDKSGGNPAAAVYLNAIDDLTDREMLVIAQQMKGYVSEVGFIAALKDNEFRIRYFSSEKEVQFCGHASIAICYDLLVNDPHLQSYDTLVLNINKGALSVKNCISEKDAVFIAAPRPQHRTFDINIYEALAVLGLKQNQLDDFIAPGIVNAGNTTLCLCLKSLTDVLGTNPDFMTLQTFCKQHDLDVVNIFTKDVYLKTSFLRTRVFAAPFGYLEDPATDSGNAALLNHLHKCGLWKGDAVTLEQGPDKTNPNKIEIAEMQTDGDAVMFGGRAILRIAGDYFI